MCGIKNFDVLVIVVLWLDVVFVNKEENCCCDVDWLCVLGIFVWVIVIEIVDDVFNSLYWIVIEVFGCLVLEWFIVVIE